MPGEDIDEAGQAGREGAAHGGPDAGASGTGASGTGGTDQGGLGVEDSLALIAAQRASVGQRLEPNPVLLYGLWSVTYLLGFGGLHLVRADVAGVPLPVAGGLFALLIVLALVLTGVHTRRVTSGLRGVTAETEGMVGKTYLLGFASVIAVAEALRWQGASEEVLALAWPGLSLLVVGVMYMLTAAMWRFRVQFYLGAWVLLTDAVAVLLGDRVAYLVLALAGGGGFLAGAVVCAILRDRNPARVRMRLPGSGGGRR